MKIQNPTKPGKNSSFLASLILGFDGFTTLLYGLLSLFITLIGDPPDFSVETKDAGIRLGEIFALLCLVYLVICFISLNYWQKGKRAWDYVVLGLGLLHIAGSGYQLTDPYLGLFAFLFYPLFFVSLILNISLLAIIITGRVRSASSLEHGKA